MKRMLKLSLCFAVATFSQLISAPANLPTGIPVGAPDVIWSSPPTVLSTASVSAPQVVIDSNGNATVVWVESNAVKTISHPLGGSWGSTITLSSGGTASTPSLGVDSSGNVTCVWLESGNVMANTLPFGGSWGTATNITLLIGGTSSQPQLAVDSTGNAVAVWINGGIVQASTKLFGGDWVLTTTNLSNLSSPTSDNPQIAISNNGKVVAVWHTVISGADMIGWNTSTVSGSWGSSRSVFAGNPAFNHNFPALAMDNSGNAALAWYRYNLVGTTHVSATVLASSLFNASSGWSLPSILSNLGIVRDASKMKIKLTFDGNGNAVAVWVNSYDGSTFNVESTVLPVRASWLPSFSLTSFDVYSFDADTAVNSSGDVIAVMTSFNGTNTIIQSMEENSAGFTQNVWTTAQSITSTHNNISPRVATTLTGGSTINAVATWIDSDGVNTTLQAVTGSRAVVIPPSNVAVVQNSTNYGVFTDYYNTVSWDFSTEPSVQGYLIYRDGVFSTFVDSSVQQFIDHNAVQNGSVTYGVSTLNAQSEQSPMATASFP